MSEKVRKQWHEPCATTRCAICREYVKCTDPYHATKRKSGEIVHVHKRCLKNQGKESEGKE